jgi:fibronectin-binding autotransporter adhesin
VSLGGNNTYIGGTFFDNGTTIVGSDANLGDPAGQMLWSGGAVRFTGSATNARPLGLRNSANDCVIVVDTNQTVQLSGVSTNSNNEELRKAGPGTLVLTGSGDLRLFVDGGTAIVAGDANLTNGTQFHNISSTNDVATLIFKDNALLQSDGSFDIADGNLQTNAIVQGELYIQDNATLILEELYVGKFLNATGRVYQSGGVVTNHSTAGQTWRLGGNTEADTNTFGGYYLSGGQLILQEPLQVGRYGAGELVVSGSGLLSNGVSGGNINLGEQATGSGSMTVNGGTVVLASDSFLRVPFNGVSGTLAISNGGSVTVGTFQMGVTNTSTGSATVGPNGTLTVGQVNGQAASSLAFNNGTLRAIASSATFLEGLANVTIGAGGLTVDTDGNAITVNQNIGGSGVLTKTGAGTLTLESQSYIGNTVVNAGTLAGNTSLAGTVLQGNLVVNSGGAVQPGGLGLGIIYASNGKGVTLGGAANLEIAKAGSFSFLSDKLQADGSIGQGGALNVSINEPSHTTALTVGNQFTLFQAGGGLSGAFTTVNLPTVDPANGNTLTWNTSLLATAGIISVASTTSPIVTDPPPALTNLIVGGEVQLSWGSEYEGYTLQVQTNTLSEGLQNNWVDVPGSTSVTATNFPVDKSLPTTFYRLIYPNAP